MTGEVDVTETINYVVNLLENMHLYIILTFYFTLSFVFYNDKSQCRFSVERAFQSKRNV